jgi:Fe2+ transport system protein FeoA
MITTLAALKGGVQAVVRDIRGGQGVRRRLNHLGVHPGDTLGVVRSGYRGGPVLIRVHGIQMGIGHGVAEKIEVETEGT